MNRFLLVHLVVIVCVVAWCAQPAPSQPPRANRLKIELEEGRNRTTEQRVARQVEVIRLEKMIEHLQSRVTWLERQLLGTNQFPAITVLEAQATLQFAEAQLKATEQLQEKGAASETQVAGDQLAVVRARGQLAVAKAAQADRTVALEIEVTRAQRRLAEETQKQEQLQKLVVRGYGSEDGLRLQESAVELAQQELQRAQGRLALQHEIGGEKEREPVRE